MASSKGYLDFILEQLSAIHGIEYRAMMGEFILYCDGKIIGGIYDNRLLVKITPSAAALTPDAPREFPYEGAKPMLLVENVDDRSFLEKLIQTVWAELPAPKPKREKKASS